MPNLIDLSDRHDMFYWQTNRQISAEQDKTLFLERHTRIDTATVAAAVNSGMTQAGYTGQDTQVSQIHPPIARGLINNVIPVTLASGKNIIIRMHPKDVKNGYFWVEKAICDLVKEKGIPTYTPIIVDDSREVVDVDFMLSFQLPYKAIQDYWPLSPDLEKTLVRETGKYAALIHQVKPQGFGFFLNSHAKEKGELVGQYSQFQQHIYAALDEDLSFLVEHQILTAHQRQQIEKTIDDHQALMVLDQPSLIHNDIADWNQLTDGHHVTAMMDWDEAFGGDPIMELSAYSLFFGEQRLQWFIEGYERVKKLEDYQEKFQLFKLRYLLSKLHLRKKRSLVSDTPQLKRNLLRGLEALQEVFKYFKL